jgi:glycosyltransferase involved in cell wall biosynthesis
MARHGVETFCSSNHRFHVSGNPTSLVSTTLDPPVRGDGASGYGGDPFPVTIEQIPSLVLPAHHPTRPMPTPALSVVMPAYNSERFIGQAIESVLGQTVADLELLVVDDGSTDRTAAIVSELGSRDPRVRFLQQPNSGRPSFPRNLALESARGRYVSFLDSDDFWYPKRSEMLLDGLDGHPAWSVVFSDFDYVDEAGRPTGETYLASNPFVVEAQSYLNPLGKGWFDCGPRFYEFMSLKYAALHTQTVLIDREKMNSSMLRFDTTYLICDDTDLWLRLALHGRFGYLEESLGGYRQHGASITKRDIVFKRDSVYLHETNYQRGATELSNASKRRYRAKIAAYCGHLAYALDVAGDSDAARRSYLRAFSWERDPRSLWQWVKTFIRRPTG